jgi:hypothetical protein
MDKSSSTLSVRGGWIRCAHRLTVLCSSERGTNFLHRSEAFNFDTSWAWLPLLPCPIPILRRTSDWGGWIIQETKTRPGKRYSSFLFPFRNKLVSLTAESKVSCRIQMGSNSLPSPFILLQRIFLFPKNQL